MDCLPFTTWIEMFAAVVVAFFTWRLYEVSDQQHLLLQAQHKAERDAQRGRMHCTKVMLPPAGTNVMVNLRNIGKLPLTLVGVRMRIIDQTELVGIHKGMPTAWSFRGVTTIIIPDGEFD